MIDNIAIKLYISPDGSDVHGDGSYEKPFATVLPAQNIIRTAIKNGGLKEDAYIYFKSGTYYLTETIHIGIDDFDANCYVHYENANGETARIVGGIPVVNWSDPDGDGIFEADVLENSNIYALFENGRRLTIARDTDWADKTVTDPSHLQAVYGGPSSWFGEILKISELNGNKISTYLTKCEWSGSLEYVQGAREYIDEADEWAIEGTKIYYKPADPTSLKNSEIIAGLVDNVITVTGTDDTPVKNIVISGLRLEMNNFGENLGAQARANNVLAEYDTNLFALVYLNNTENVTVKDCYLKNAGYIGITLNHHAQHNTICGNYITKTGYAGIFMIGENPGSLNYCNKCNTVSNNKIENAGNFVGHGAGIYLINSGENTVTHNDISNVPRYGISMKGMRYGVFADNGHGDVPFEDHWKFNQTTKNLFAYNKVYNTGIRSGDGGGIEGWGIGRDNVIDHNIL